MIRRDIPASPTKDWLLIRQQDHARLAGVMASAWRAPLLDDANLQRQLIGAVYLHDDGWQSWDARPAIDATALRPVQFTEMPAADAEAIWQSSIEAAAERGDLAGAMVRQHFTVLAERASGGASGGEHQDFLAAQRQFQQSRLKQSPTSDADDRVALRALEFLQMFDYLSLWICCAERTEPLKLTTPDKTPMEIHPIGAEAFRVEPWPFVGSELILQTPAARLAASDLDGKSHVLMESLPQCWLHWRLVTSDRTAAA